jgi:hypothetical protein
VVLVSPFTNIWARLAGGKGGVVIVGGVVFVPASFSRLNESVWSGSTIRRSCADWVLMQNFVGFCYFNPALKTLLLSGGTWVFDGNGNFLAGPPFFL